MVSQYWRPRVAALLILLGTTQSAIAQTLPTLKDAIEAAWLKQPAARAGEARQEEAAARQRAAGSLFPEPPSLTLAHRTDQLNANQGRREMEAELDFPLWTPGLRGATRGTAATEQALLNEQQRAAKWRVAGEVREAHWAVQLARIEMEIAQRKSEEAAQLRQDVERRTKAGDLARADLNQAAAAEQNARVAQVSANAALARAQSQFTLLTGLMQIDANAEPAAQEAGQQAAIDVHPAVSAALAQMQAARARLAQSQADTRASPTLGLGVTRDRSSFGAAADTTVRVAITIPFSGQVRNAPRNAAANAEAIEAQATLGVERERLLAEVKLARAEAEQAQQVSALLTRRLALAQDTQTLYAKSFRLGETDLVTRLRADAERFDAELALARAKVEAARAISRLNQSLGLLP
jgi:outer membrane protein, heavy metal efflux system